MYIIIIYFKYDFLAISYMRKSIKESLKFSILVTHSPNSPSVAYTITPIANLSYKHMVEAKGLLRNSRLHSFLWDQCVVTVFKNRGYAQTLP